MLERRHKTLDETTQLYAEHVNPQWVRLINLLDMNRRYVHCEGATLTSEHGENYLDFLSGYGVYNVGHAHPFIREQLIEELESFGPSMLQTHVPELAGELAQRLCSLAGGGLERAFFTSTGSEGVETSMKFARAYTRREWILYGNGGFHGLTCGALSLMSSPWWRDRFGPMLQTTTGVPFGDLGALETELKSKKYAAFIIEPIQGESGITLPPQGYLRAAQDLCRKYGTLFVLDEVQTGLYRTGSFLAAQHYGAEPDMVILAKALSGSFVPVGAVLMRDDISKSVYRSMEKSFVHASTFGENAMAMRAGLATLDVLQNEQLGARAEVMGRRLRDGVNALVPKHQMLKGAHGLGLFNGVAFQAPSTFGLKTLFHGFNMLHAGLFGQMVVRQLFHDAQILTQMCGNNYLVVKAVPPLIVNEQQIDSFISAIDQLLHEIETERTGFWSQGLMIGKRALS